MTARFFTNVNFVDISISSALVGTSADAGSTSIVYTASAAADPWVADTLGAALPV
jgi:hypothetical protein